MVLCSKDVADERNQVRERERTGIQEGADQAHQVCMDVELIDRSKARKLGS